MDTEEDPNFDRALHHNKKVVVRDWWKEPDDVEAKKLRRQKHREQNKNFNKQNKVIIGKGEKKRFYTKPTMSWGQLISNDPSNYHNDDDIAAEDDGNGSSDDAFADYDPNNTNFDKFKGFDYAEIDDDNDGQNEMDDIKEAQQQETKDGFGDNNVEDIECDEEEVDEEENEEFEMWNIEEMENDINMEHDDGEIKKDETEDDDKFNIFDENGNCILTLNDEDTMFYRHETDEDEMWKYWKGLRKEFRKHVNNHSQWAEKKRENARFLKLFGDNDTDSKDIHNQGKNRNRPKKRRYRDF